MIIKLFDNFEIKDDGNQYTLREFKQVDKKGRRAYNNYGYYVELQTALKRLARLEISRKKECTLSEYIETLDKLYEKYSSICKPRESI